MNVLCTFSFINTSKKTKFFTPKQFHFQNGHSTDQAVIQFVNQIFEAFENNLYTLSVFIGLSRAFDTLDHTILFRKLELYGIRGNNHNWIKSLLSNRKQYIETDPITKTSLELVKYGVPQVSILALLLFLLYFNVISFICQVSSI